MDGKKAFGVESAIGRALAEHSLEEKLRAVETGDEFRRFLNTIPTPLPPGLVAEWSATIGETEWRKARAKLLLGASLARGKIALMPDHEVERRGGVTGR
jgi:hypothetical protein